MNKKHYLKSIFAKNKVFLYTEEFYISIVGCEDRF